MLNSFLPLAGNSRKLLPSPATLLTLCISLLDVLFFHLRKLGIDASERHPVFENIKDALDTAIKQRYAGHCLFSDVWRSLVTAINDVCCASFYRYILKAKPTSHENDNFTYELAERALEKDMHDRVKHFIQSVRRLLHLQAFVCAILRVISSELFVEVTPRLRCLLVCAAC